MICRYCKQEIEGTTGWGMSESLDGTIEPVAWHEECYQQSGEDGGYIERTYKMLEKLEDENI